MQIDNEDEFDANIFIAYESYKITPSDLGMVVEDEHGIPICHIEHDKDINNELAGFLLMDHFKEVE